MISNVNKPLSATNHHQGEFSSFLREKINQVEKREDGLMAQARRKSSKSKNCVLIMSSSPSIFQSFSFSYAWLAFSLFSNKNEQKARRMKNDCKNDSTK
jgi:hypothetical protein